MLKWILGFIIIISFSCNRNTRGLMGKKNLHDQYQERLEQAGLAETALGRAWKNAALQALARPADIILPHRESGYFDAAEARATGLEFVTREGERISVNITLVTDSAMLFFTDLWNMNDSLRPRFIQSWQHGDTLRHDIEKPGRYLVRLQPELLRAVQYTITIGSGPSLAFPVRNGQIKSFWGADRDAGVRRHEGIDIFAPRGTPVLAVEEGRISRVNDNQLGGKVIFQRIGDYSIYYAHLDSQIAKPGDKVFPGDTIGLVGNTGNARTTAPHLHLGIYTFGGAVDPLPFVDPTPKLPPPISIPVTALMDSGRYAGNNRLLGNNTMVRAVAVYQDNYRVQAPDGSLYEVRSKDFKPLSSVKTVSLNDSLPMYAAPGSSLVKKILGPARNVGVLAIFNDFQLVEIDGEKGWIRP